MFDDYDKYMRVPDEWNSPEIKPYTPGENLVAWLTDDRGRDQFVIRFGSETEVYWNNASQGKPDPVYHRSVSYFIMATLLFGRFVWVYLINSSLL